MRSARPTNLRRIPTLGAACLVVGALVGARPVAAQASAPESPVQPGAWVRVTPWDAAGRVTGRVLEADSAFVSLRPRPGAPPLQFRYADLRRLEQEAGRASRAAGALRGAGRGALVGLAGGVLLTAATFLSGADEGCGDCFVAPTGVAAAAGVLLTGAGVVVGGVVGAARPRQTWRPVHLPSRVGATRGRAGAPGVTVHLAF
jgi:hypothetical protein